MADDFKKQIAGFYRVENAYPITATDDEILAFEAQDDPEGLQAVTEEAYGHKAPEPVEAHPTLTAALQAASDTADEVNKQTEEWAGRDLGKSSGALESVGILANRGLSDATAVTRSIGEAGDAVGAEMDEATGRLGKVGKVAGFLAGPVNPSMTVKAVASLMPRTPMQQVFNAILTPASDLKAMAMGSKQILKGLRKESQVAMKSVFGAIRSPAERFPESKLAAAVERFLVGSDGADKFALTNKSAVNEVERSAAIPDLIDEERTLGAIEEGQIREKLKSDSAWMQTKSDHEVSLQEGLIRDTQANMGAQGEAGRLGKEASVLGSRQVAMAVEEQKSEFLKTAHEATIKADLAVDDAMGLAGKAERGIHVARAVTGAVRHAQKEVSVVYDMAHDLASKVQFDFKSLAGSFAEKFNDVGYKLSMLKESPKAQKVLAKLWGTTDYLSKLSIAGKENAQGIVAGFSDSSSNVLKGIADKNKPAATAPEVATLSDAQRLYEDLNTLARDTGERVYHEAADIIMSAIRDSGAGKGIVVSGKGALEDAGIAVNLWDRAREARMHLDVVSQNQTVEKITGLIGKDMKGDPSKALELVVGPKAEMPLIDFMRIAPKESKAIIRRESLRTGFEAVSSAKPGSSVEALSEFTKNTGSRNFDTLHGGKDAELLEQLAISNDGLHVLKQEAPKVQKQVEDTVGALIKLLSDSDTAIQKAQNAIAKEQSQSREALGHLADLSRNAELARQKETLSRVEKGITAINDAFAVSTKKSSRIGEAGKVIIDMARNDDRHSNKAIIAGTGMEGVGLGMSMLGVPGATRMQASGAVLLAYGVMAKSPRAMSNIYYSEAGRGIMEGIASAPSAKEAAVGLVKLTKLVAGPAAKYGGLYMMDKSQSTDRLPRNDTPQNLEAGSGSVPGEYDWIKKQGGGLGALEGLRSSPTEFQGVPRGRGDMSLGGQRPEDQPGRPEYMDYDPTTGRWVD